MTRQSVIYEHLVENLEELSLAEINREIARKSLIHFTTYTMPEYRVGWFHRKLAAALDQFLIDVVEEKSPRLIIEAPPRHGKSELASRRFPAFALGQYPDLSFISTSYASDLASSMNRDVQRIICSDEYQELFPKTRLWGANVRTVADGSYLRNSDIFEVVNHRGVYKSAGIGAGIGGRGGHICLIDDPIKDAAEAGSETVRKNIWDWYTSTFYTRQASGGGIILIMTRWHMDDLAGHLITSMKKGGEQWKVMKFPAVAEEDEEFRKKGEELSPERYSLTQLNSIRVGTSDDPGGVGSRVWASLYQQNPTAAEGGIFKREDWRFVKMDERWMMMEAKERRRYLERQHGVIKVIQSWDTAIGGKRQNDFAAVTTLGVTKNSYIILNVWKDKIKYPTMRREVQTHADMWLPDVITIEGGGAAAGKAVVQDLDEETRLPLKEIITDKDKVQRAELISPTQEAHACVLPEGEDWVSGFVDNCADFPNIKNDDDVDSFMQAMEEAKGGVAAIEITTEFLEALAGVR